MDNKSNLVLLLFLFSCLSPIFPDWIQKGKVIEVLSGDTFIHYGFQDKKKQKYKLACVEAESPRTKKGKYQKKILTQKIKGKEIEGILRGKLKEYFLADVFDIEKTKKNGHYTSLAFTLAVHDKVLKKINEYPECWLEDN
ncbi:MAG TPA: hypothetical protein PLM36_25635 [Leptospiraceae bacterium]|nr:hypothetical protein [Leptospiraceae bacterium]HMY34447.1 hypothetical protein [Leptospiraceae bacterium]HNK55604.1 hypothetical protein [Leptospiraceae bacterium]HNK93414.1 hypothetical protein [Leptospiraceae bacterium]HNM90207.1 hypothetical protein [Leptospiraceae bacterium]